ncbi:hypothetical protein HELRODRAFT_185223 [Helobdella robusta]|uniref:E3 ubiquitin-protein ligase NRDP1 n=1 Tax=Helobdella robusta TaxID=6412 RepID=T1FMJ0_HELRO|nr:hypothetical protein HELRODRAFT_185223 [Helobdella robusta]ESN90684.1 hypothetical protein HELRODRAFT_185223 [Helobdella robusta]
MGYDVCRFDGEVDEELLCPICSGVLENPVQASHCEHAFCLSCINGWLARQNTCPIDRGVLRKNNLKSVPRILRNLLSRLKITCNNSELGCPEMLKLDSLPAHLLECDFNPKKPVTCDKGCGLTMAKDELAEHNCIKDLRNLVQQQQQQISILQKEANDLREHQTELKRELQTLRENFRMQRHLTGGHETHPQQELDEIRRWVDSLQMSRVTRWGGMISTPDAVLQTVIKRALIECGCPPSIVNDLIENSHERRWPIGLKTLEARQLNRRMYENYVCKRIPGKQAVLVMSCENEHMNSDMLVEPGLVMIFAHGVE